jgi:hypothetical protein
MFKEWPGCFDDFFRIRNVSYGSHLVVLSVRLHLGSTYVWLPCHISKKLWTLAILCSFHSSASFSISESFSVLVVSKSESMRARIPLLDDEKCLTTTVSRRVSPEVFDCLQRITSRPREKLASTPSPCGMIENMSHATPGRSAYIECVSPCWHHQLVMSGIHHVLLISIGSEW